MRDLAHELRVDPGGRRDRPHRGEDGRLFDLGIEGVQLERPPRHVDHRGSLLVAATVGHPFWSEPIVHCEWVVSSPGMIKGWGMHRESVDRYVVMTGRIRVVLYDGRVESPTFQALRQFHFSDESPGWLRIPCGVWHASQNYGERDAVFLNFPTEPHQYDDPDKYRVDPYDRSQIDFDWTVRGG
jgi:dTDP-4-dehydrorhamnose 3,5-epimerase